MSRTNYYSMDDESFYDEPCERGASPKLYFHKTTRTIVRKNIAIDENIKLSYSLNIDHRLKVRRTFVDSIRRNQSQSYKTEG